jgi:hypothetical protein
MKSILSLILLLTTIEARPEIDSSMPWIKRSVSSDKLKSKIPPLLALNTQSSSRSNSPNTRSDSFSKAETREPQISVLNENIDYTYSFEADRSKFKGFPFLAETQTTKWTVLVNFHGNMLLNTSNVFDPKKRTLSWAAPYSIASQVYQIGKVHSGLALPVDWSRGKLRKNITLIFIPPNSNISFLIGYAKEQIGADFLDPRSGGGVQMRLKSLPTGTITITLPLFGATSPKSIDGNARKIYLEPIFFEALNHARTKGFISSPDAKAIAISSEPVSNALDYQSWLKEFFNLEETADVSTLSY